MDISQTPVKHAEYKNHPQLSMLSTIKISSSSIHIQLKFLAVCLHML